jgi:hypothetical protein
MSGNFRLIPLILMLVLLPSRADAADFVTITHDHGYPGVGDDYEPPDMFVVSRTDGMTAQQSAATNAYFDAVRKIIAEAPVPSQCCVRQIDSPFVRIDISLDGRVYALLLTENSSGLVISLEPGEDERRTASVMERVLKLSEDWKSKGAR